MDDKILYIKLTTGEELIAEAYRHDGDIVLLNPMTLEYDSDSEDGRKIIYMARFNPMANDKTLRIDRQHTVFVTPVLPEVGQYYRSSVEYCIKVMDENFRKGMKVASHMSGKMLTQAVSEMEEPEPFTDDDMVLAPTSNTRH